MRNRVYDRTFSDILDYIEDGDCLVLNDTKVRPWRLIGRKRNTGGKVDVLLLERIGKDSFKCLINANHALKDRTEIIFDKGLEGLYLKNGADFSIIKLKLEDSFTKLDKIGYIPLPPYIRRLPDKKDKLTYQTVFAKRYGAVASPTAGLHFTNDLLDRIKKKGVNIFYVTLHVNYATFKPVEVYDISKHKMHTEEYILSKKTADGINEAKKQGNRIIAVGTTVVRVLEAAANKRKDGLLEDCRGKTDIFIYPPYKFKVVDALLTNFHMPKTTLLMLVSAFMKNKSCLPDRCESEDLLFKAYKHAIAKQYRFLSYGDAMLII